MNTRGFPECFTGGDTVKNKNGLYHASVFCDDIIICTLQFAPAGFKTAYQAIDACCHKAWEWVDEQQSVVVSDVKSN